MTIARWPSASGAKKLYVPNLWMQRHKDLGSLKAKTAWKKVKTLPGVRVS